MYSERNTERLSVAKFPLCLAPLQSQSFVCVSGKRGWGGRKRLTSSVAPSDFIPFSLLLVHEHSKNTVGLLSPVCLHTLVSIFTHLGATQMPRGGVRVAIIVIVAVWNLVK